MRYWHFFAVHRIGSAFPHRFRRKVGDDLMTVEVEIDPMVGASTFGAAKQIAVEATSGGEVVDGKGEMERW